jgi:hypothetical protein
MFISSPKHLCEAATKGGIQYVVTATARKKWKIRIGKFNNEIQRGPLLSDLSHRSTEAQNDE